MRKHFRRRWGAVYAFRQLLLRFKYIELPIRRVDSAKRMTFLNEFVFAKLSGVAVHRAGDKQIGILLKYASMSPNASVLGQHQPSVSRLRSL